MIIELFLFFAALIAFYCFKNSRRLGNLPPGPRPIFPIVGNIPQLLKYRKHVGSNETFDELVKIYGPVVFLKFGRLSQVIVQDLNLVKEVLSSDIWVDRVYDPRITERSFGKELGIIFTSGGVWKEMRRFTMRTLKDFGFGKQKSMETVIDEEIDLIIESMDKAEMSGEEMSMRQFFTVSILNVLWSMVAGVRFSHEDAKLKKLIQLIDETSKNNPAKANISTAFPILWNIIRHTETMRKRRVFIEELHKFFREILEERRKDGSYRESSPRDFFDVFLQEIDSKNDPSGFYTDEQFIMVTYDLFVAGAETTTNTLEFAMLYMTLNPEVQSKVQKEIDGVVGRRRITLEDRQKMPYVEATIIEIQRLANVLPVIFRGATQDTSIAEFHIPKDTLAGVSLISLHLDPKTWPNPQTLNPLRFLDNENNIVNAHKILPFGLGKRVCLGESLARATLFKYFASVLQRYTLSYSPKRPKPSTVPVFGFTLSPQEYFVVLKER